MGKPKSGISPSATGLRRSHLKLKLARVVNGKSPVKAYTTKRQSGKTLAASMAAGKQLVNSKSANSKSANSKSDNS